MAEYKIEYDTAEMSNIHEIISATIRTLTKTAGAPEKVTSEILIQNKEVLAVLFSALEHLTESYQRIGNNEDELFHDTMSHLHALFVFGFIIGTRIEWKVVPVTHSHLSPTKSEVLN